VTPLNREALIGSWRLAAFQIVTEDGTVHLPFGPTAQGYISYGADGYMQVNIQGEHRPRFTSDNFLEPTPADLASASRYIAYAGRYTVEADRIIHHIEVSFFPNWVGVDQVRQATLEGDRLILSTPPMPYQGKRGQFTLHWVRAETSPLP